MVCGETWSDIQEGGELLGRKPTAADFEPSTWAVGLLGKQLSAVQFNRAIRDWRHICRQVGAFFEGYDVLLTPTLATPPPKTGELQAGGAELAAMKVLGRLNAGGLIQAFAGIEALVDQVFAFMPFTPLFNATGQPAMSVPLHWNDAQLPIGVQFVGRYADEATLFRLAAQLEEAHPWADRVPPVHG
jgi:amidase